MLNQSTLDKVTAFRDVRDWRQFHTPKDLALSLTLEAAELLEIFQWSGIDLQVNEKRAQMQEELADVLIYCILLADVTGMDLDDIVLAKLRKNEEKYPAEEASGRSDKYTEYGKRHDNLQK